MINIPTTEEAEGKRVPRWDVVQNIKKVWSMAMSVLSGRAMCNEVSRQEALHPEFCICNDLGDVVWYQNKSWGPQRKPPFKVGFYFNDPAVLSGCPWICKFALNANKKISGFTYFAVAYGDPSLAKKDFGLQNMLRWVMQFDHPSLMKYDGTLLKMLKE